MKPKQQTFKIESLLDKEGEYVGIFDSKTGLLLRHEGALTKNSTEIEQEETPIAEQDNENQLKLF